MKICLTICLASLIAIFMICETFYAVEVRKHQIEIDAAAKLFHPSIEIVPPDGNEHL